MGIMRTTDLIARIQSAAPLTAQADWDVSGIQIASGKTDVRNLAVTLDPLATTVSKALDWGADFILTHHPLCLPPRLPDRLDEYHDILRLTLSGGAWLYAAHTSLDTNPKGPAAWLAGDLGLRDFRVLDPLPEQTPGDIKRGFAIIGDMPEPMSFDDFARFLSAHVNRNFWTLAGRTPETVSAMAYCPGSGAGLADKAFAAGADVFVTGDVKHHPALTAERTGLIIDVGHFVLEHEMMRRFAAELADDPALAGVKVQFFNQKDPLRVHIPEGA